jgi:hypothetical protein
VLNKTDSGVEFLLIAPSLVLAASHF